MHERVEAVRRAASASARWTSGGRTTAPRLDPCQPLPLPPHWDPDRVGEVWRVDYAARFEDAAALARASTGSSRRPQDRFRIALVVVDVQNTFCTPGFELFVAGRSGTRRARRLAPALRVRLPEPRLGSRRRPDARHAPGAPDLPPDLLVDEDGPASGALHARDGRRRRVGPLAGRTRPPQTGSGSTPSTPRSTCATTRARSRRAASTTSPSGPSTPCAAASATRSCRRVEEALFFHCDRALAPAAIQPKGDNPLTEHYSMLGPEVDVDLEGEPLGRAQPAADRAAAALRRRRHRRPGEEPLRRVDDRGPARRPDRARAAAWRRRSTCSRTARRRSSSRAVDYTDEADAAFARFAEAGAHVVRSDRAAGRSGPGVVGEARSARV